MNGERIERECAMIASHRDAASRSAAVLLPRGVGLIDRAYTNAEKSISARSPRRRDYVSFLSHLLSDAVNSRLDEAAEPLPGITAKRRTAISK